MFLAGEKERFSLFDFSSHNWRTLNELGAAAPAGDATAKLPTISVDLWFEVSEADLHLVLPILPSSEWRGTQVGIRIEFGAISPIDLLHRFREKQQEAQTRAAAIVGGAGDYVPWPKTLTDFLEKELHKEFRLGVR